MGEEDVLAEFGGGGCIGWSLAHGGYPRWQGWWGLSINTACTVCHSKHCGLCCFWTKPIPYHRIRGLELWALPDALALARTTSVSTFCFSKARPFVIAYIHPAFYVMGLCLGAPAACNALPTLPPMVHCLILQDSTCTDPAPPPTPSQPKTLTPRRSHIPQVSPKCRLPIPQLRAPGFFLRIPHLFPAHPPGSRSGLPCGAGPDTEKEIISIITNSILSNSLLCENNLLLSQPRGQGDGEAQGIMESQAN